MTSIATALANLALQKLFSYTATAKKFNINQSTLCNDYSTNNIRYKQR